MAPNHRINELTNQRSPYESDLWLATTLSATQTLDLGRFFTRVAEGLERLTDPGSAGAGGDRDLSPP